MAMADAPRTLDPALAGSQEEHMVLRNIYEGLTRIDENLQAQPELATRWSSDQLAKIWTVNLGSVEMSSVP